MISGLGRVGLAFQGLERHLPLNALDQALFAEHQALLGQVHLVHDVRHVQRALRVHRQDQVDVERVLALDGPFDAPRQGFADLVEQAVLGLAELVGEPALGVHAPHGEHRLEELAGLGARLLGDLLHFGPVQQPEVALLQGFLQAYPDDEVASQAANVAQTGHGA